MELGKISDILGGVCFGGFGLTLAVLGVKTRINKRDPGLSKKELLIALLAIFFLILGMIFFFFGTVLVTP
jgi:hypothetical protein